LVICGLLALTAVPALADRGQGSIRAAGRMAPAPRADSPQPRGGAPAGPSRAAPDVHVEVRTQPPPRVAPPPARDWDDRDEDVQHAGGFVQRPPGRALRGQRVHDLPHHVSIFFNNQNYFYDDDGNYYQQQNGDYIVVQPPVGVVVAALPPGAVSIAAGPTTYYYLDGIFYVAQNDSFAVVNPPAGIIVPDLPSGANQVVVNGNVCYQFNGLNYQPSVQDGVTVYTVNPM